MLLYTHLLFCFPLLLLPLTPLMSRLQKKKTFGPLFIASCDVPFYIKISRMAYRRRKTHTFSMEISSIVARKAWRCCYCCWLVYWYFLEGFTWTEEITRTRSWMLGMTSDTQMIFTIFHFYRERVAFCVRFRRRYANTLSFSPSGWGNAAFSYSRCICVRNLRDLLLQLIISISVSSWISAKKTERKRVRFIFRPKQIHSFIHFGHEIAIIISICRESNSTHHFTVLLAHSSVMHADMDSYERFIRNTRLVVEFCTPHCFHARATKAITCYFVPFTVRLFRLFWFWLRFWFSCHENQNEFPIAHDSVL